MKDGMSFNPTFFRRKIMQIAIDGPASSGKSTVAKIIADKLNLVYLDTGAMYRAVTLYILDNNIDYINIDELNNALKLITIDFKGNVSQQEVYLNGTNVSKEIRTSRVTQHVSEISAIEIIRKFLVRQQQAIATNHSVIMDGRDIGTVVLPEADYKFYLIASSRVRAERRFQENLLKGYSNQTIDEIEQSIIDRDSYDMNREISPLMKANDAIEIDTSLLDIEQVVQEILLHIVK